MATGLGGFEVLALYSEAIATLPKNPGVPALFRDIFKNAYLPYRDPETLKSFFKEINFFSHDHSERLGDAFEYLLSVLGSQGDAGQFRTPRHIIDFMVEVMDPKKNETILNSACGTAGFLISAWKHILKNNSALRSVDAGQRPVSLGNLLTLDVVPEGIIFQSGTAYKALRKMLVNTSLVAVVSLPTGVFKPYSGVKTSILILDKRVHKQTDSVLFVKVQNDGFNLGAQRRAVVNSDLPEATRLLRSWMTAPQAFEGDGVMAQAVARSRIGENGDFGLSGERYVVSSQSESHFAMRKIDDVLTTSAGGTPLRSKSEFYVLLIRENPVFYLICFIYIW